MDGFPACGEAVSLRTASERLNSMRERQGLSYQASDACKARESIPIQGAMCIHTVYAHRWLGQPRILQSTHKGKLENLQ